MDQTKTDQKEKEQEKSGRGLKKGRGFHCRSPIHRWKQEKKT